MSNKPDKASVTGSTAITGTGILEDLSFKSVMAGLDRLC